MNLYHIVSNCHWSCINTWSRCILLCTEFLMRVKLQGLPHIYEYVYSIANHHSEWERGV